MAIAQDAVGFTFNVQNPEGGTLRASRIVISGQNDDTPQAQEATARSLFVGGPGTLIVMQPQHPMQSISQDC